MNKDSKSQDAERTAWWRAARFGMFVHWNMSSLAGSEISWARKAPRPLDTGNAPAGQVVDPVYDSLYKRFDPVDFDAKAWIKLLRDSGMKYFVFTAKHHDGFCMWDTKFTDYSIMNTTFRRDVVRELAEACHEAGIPLGIYYSQRDWHHPDYGIGDNRKYIDYMNGQLRELLTNYGKVDVIWFDSYGYGDLLDFWQIDETWKLIKELQPAAVINNRLAILAEYNGQPEPYLGDFDTPEQKIGKMQMTRGWESCITVVRTAHPGQGWSYRPDGKVKPLDEVVRTLVACASGDGNLLLDVGPDSTGTIPADQSSRLLEIGQWLKICGKSIYGTRGGPFMPGGYGGSTRKDNTVYIHVLNWNGGAIVLPPLPGKVLKSSLLTGGAVNVGQTADALRITVAEKDRQSVDTVVKLELDRSVMELELIPAAP